MASTSWLVAHGWHKLVHMRTRQPRALMWPGCDASTRRAVPEILPRSLAQLHRHPVPKPSEHEMALNELVRKIGTEGLPSIFGSSAAEHAAAIAGWSESYKLDVAFEVRKRELLTQELRDILGMGPPPPPIVVRARPRPPPCPRVAYASPTRRTHACPRAPLRADAHTHATPYA
jgi:hypothetical protein